MTVALAVLDAVAARLWLFAMMPTPASKAHKKLTPVMRMRALRLLFFILLLPLKTWYWIGCDFAK